MDETRPLLLEFDAALEPDVREMLAMLRFTAEPAPQTKNFGGDGQLLALLVEVGRQTGPVLVGAIAAIAAIRRGRSVKIDGFEVHGMSASEIIALREAFRRDEDGRAG